MTICYHYHHFKVVVINHIGFEKRHKEGFYKQQQQQICLRTHNWEWDSNPGLASGYFHYSSRHWVNLNLATKSICTNKALKKPKKEMLKFLRACVVGSYFPRQPSEPLKFMQVKK